MLSLLSLLLASGTVLRADTELWTSSTYPDPRTNSTTCNTWQNSTLCDPDHILTDQWRQNINENINRQKERLREAKKKERLREANILYVDDAPAECRENTTSGVQIYVILAKRIHTASNQTITDTDLINFGNELAEQYGLNNQSCRNFLILIGVEAARLAYFRTGADLKLPQDVTHRVFNQYTSLFNEKNYMEGLNRIIDEIGDLMIDPFPETTQAEEPTTTTSTSTEAATTIEIFDINNSTTTIVAIVLLGEANSEETVREAVPWWMLLLMISAIFLATIALILLVFAKRQYFRHPLGQMQTVMPIKSEHMPDNGSIEDLEKNNNNNTVVKIKDLDLESASSNGDPRPEAQNSTIPQENTKSDKTETDSIAESLVEDGEGNVERPTTPPRVANRLVQLNPLLLSTDTVARKNDDGMQQRTPQKMPQPPLAMVYPPLRTARRVDEHELTF